MKKEKIDFDIYNIPFIFDNMEDYKLNDKVPDIVLFSNPMYMGYFDNDTEYYNLHSGIYGVFSNKIEYISDVTVRGHCSKEELPITYEKLKEKIIKIIIKHNPKIDSHNLILRMNECQKELDKWQDKLKNYMKAEVYFNGNN